MNVGLFTLGLIPTFIRNLILLTPLELSKCGIADGPSSIVFALAAVTFSHPFEVARVHQQYHGNMNFDFRSTLTQIYQKESVAGLFRGYTPRLLHMTPIYMGWISLNESFKPSDSLSEFYKPT